MGKKASGGYYAVGKGRQVGIFNTWADCEANVKGFPGAKFKKFPTEAEAQAFVDQCKTQPVQRGGCAPPFPQPRRTLCSATSVRPRKEAISNGGPNLLSVSSQSSSSSLTPDERLQEVIKSSKRRTERSAKLLDSSVECYPVKRLRTDSPQTKGVNNLNGDKAFLPFIVDAEDYVNVYTDGACLHNGRSNPKAGVGVWFGDDHPLNISLPVDGPPTNNTAEIQAARLAIEVAAKAGFEKLRINTDSAFLIQCVTSYMHKWKKNGWKLAAGGDVKNRVELEKLDKAQKNVVIQWTKVPAHSGLHGNEMADKLASEGALRY